MFCQETHKAKQECPLISSCVFSCAGADEEAFEDNSEEYIRRDLEGSGNALCLPSPLFTSSYSTAPHAINTAMWLCIDAMLAFPWRPSCFEH